MPFRSSYNFYMHTMNLNIDQKTKQFIRIVLEFSYILNGFGCDWMALYICNWHINNAIAFDCRESVFLGQRLMGQKHTNNECVNDMCIGIIYNLDCYYVCLNDCADDVASVSTRPLLFSTSQIQIYRHDEAIFIAASSNNVTIYQMQITRYYRVIDAFENGRSPPCPHNNVSVNVIQGYFRAHIKHELLRFHWLRWIYVKYSKHTDTHTQTHQLNDFSDLPSSLLWLLLFFTIFPSVLLHRLQLLSVELYTWYTTTIYRAPLK